MRHLIIALLLMVSAGPAVAQTQIERVQAQAEWVHGASDFAARAMQYAGVVDQAATIIDQYSYGELDREQALAALDAWKADADAGIAAYRAEAARLSSGPRLTIIGQENMVGMMAAQPEKIVDTVASLVDSSDTFLRAAINGENPDPNRFQSDQFAVVQSYTQGMMVMNRLGLESVGTEHPQHHLIRAWLANGNATILALELARQRLGGEPNEFSVDDFEAAFAAQANEVRRASGDGQAAATSMLQQLRAMGTPPNAGDRERLRIIILMIESYDDSFYNELAALDVFERAMTAVTPVTNPPSFEQFMFELSAYETARDAQQGERARLGSQLQ